MIEDALGLKIYQYKKSESEKKLKKTQENIAQVQSLRKEVEPHLQGRTLWGERGTFSAIAARYWSGKRVKVTALSEEFGWSQFQEQQPDALVLFVIGDKGVAPPPAEGDAPKGGEKLVYLP